MVPAALDGIDDTVPVDDDALVLLVLWEVVSVPLSEAYAVHEAETVDV